MSFVAVAAIGAGVAGGAKIVGGLIGAGKRKGEQRAAESEHKRMKQRFANLDTSNQYTNLENTAEDLTVNTQQADFIAQQNQAQQANIMSGMQGAAGGGGIAALAQAMANQGSQQSQAASASIGQQEAANQAAAAQQAAANQSAERQGAVMAQQAEASKVGSMYSASQERLAAANAAREAAKQQVVGGISDMGESAKDIGMMGMSKLS